MRDFTEVTKSILAKRSGFQCAICGACTIAPSIKSPTKIINVGVAAHIKAASPGGPRYDPSLSLARRRDIANGMWLCQIHAKIIDDDYDEWTVSRLKTVKRGHEQHVRTLLGVPKRHAKPNRLKVSAPREYAFTSAGGLIPQYRVILDPMLRVNKLTQNVELGMLMCGSTKKERSRNRQAPWTVFVNAEWLRWVLKGKRAGFPIEKEIPEKQIYGQIPGWPDEFFEWLQSIVKTDTTFRWQRNKRGRLMLAQQPKAKL